MADASDSPLRAALTGATVPTAPTVPTVPTAAPLAPLPDTATAVPAPPDLLAASPAPAPAGVQRTPTLMLLNPKAGGGRGRKLLREIEASLAVARQRPMFFMTDDVRGARKLVDAMPAGSRIIIAGGDGSVQQLLPSLVGGGHTLALVPVGSGNDTARALGVAGKNWRSALELALQGTTSMMDLGEISFVEAGGRHERRSLFISSLAAGFDAAVTARVAGVPGWLTGLPRYLVATLAELAALRRFPVQISTDGHGQHDGDVLLASSLNTPTYGAGMPIAPAASDSDGQLDLMLAEGMGLLRVLRLLPAMLAGRHIGRPGVHHLRFTDLEASAGAPLPIAADGEYLGEVSSLRVTVRPGLLSVVRRPA